MILGYRYLDSPLIVPDGTPERPFEIQRYKPTARPGSRAPHAWLKGGESLFDLFGLEHTLLDLGAETEVVESFVEAAKVSGFPLTVLAVEDDRVRELYESDLVLIRPDQHVAWRYVGEEFDPSEVVQHVTGGRVLERA